MINTPSMQQLLEAGVHFGHQVRRGHPKMKEYIFGVRDGVHVINLEYSEKLLKQAQEAAEKFGSEGKVILFVGTKKQAQSIAKEAAEKTNAPYVNFRWVGGALTNFEEVRKNIKKLQDLAEKKEKGELKQYTKKERLLITRRLDKFEKQWGGIKNMTELPDALFVIDSVTERTAVAEANRMNIPVIGIADSNSNPMLLTYPIPGNDDATKAIKILTDAISEAYEEGLKKSGKAKVKSEKKEEVKKEEKVEKTEEQSEIAEEVAQAEEEVEKEEVKEAERAV